MATVYTMASSTDPDGWSHLKKYSVGRVILYVCYPPPASPAGATCRTKPLNTRNKSLTVAYVCECSSHSAMVAHVVMRTWS